MSPPIPPKQKQKQQQPPPRKSRALPRPNFLLDLVVGGLAGSVSKTVTAPLECVKIVMQTMGSHPKVLSGQVQPYSSVGNCVYRLWKENGIQAFWSGNLTNCLRYLPVQISNFVFADACRALFPKKDPKKDFWGSVFNSVMAGGLGGSIALFFCYPFDFAHTRLASDLVGGGKCQFSGLFDSTRKAGWGMYRGMGVTIAGVFIHRAFQYTVYNTVRGFFRELGPVSIFFLANIPRIITLPFVYPLDTVRRRLMLDAEMPVSTYQGVFHCVKEIFQNEGIAGFYQGISLDIIRGMGAVLTLMLYDQVKTWIQNQDEEEK